MKHFLKSVFKISVSFYISRRQDVNSFWSSLPLLRKITRMGPLHIHKANTHFYPKENHEITINQNPDISDWVAGINLFVL